jgi:PAS domain S-box-containing protein
MRNDHKKGIEFYKQLTESITDTFFALDKNLNFTFWNKASEEITGFSFEQVLDKNLFDIFPKIKSTVIEAVFRRVLRTGVKESFISEFPLKGRDYAFGIYVYPIQDGISVLAKDIRDFFMSELSARNSEYLFKNTFDNMLEGCAIFDRGWNYIYMNNAHAGHALLNRLEATGKNLFDVVPGFEKSDFYKAYKRTMEERIPQQVEDCFTFVDGTTRWYEARSIPVPDGIFLLTIETTERKKNEQELIRYQSILTQAESMAHLGSWWIELNEP